MSYSVLLIRRLALAYFLPKQEAQFSQFSFLLSKSLDGYCLLLYFALRYQLLWLLFTVECSQFLADRFNSQKISIVVEKLSFLVLAAAAAQK